MWEEASLAIGRGGSSLVAKNFPRNANGFALSAPPCSYLPPRPNHHPR
jgi:hypothetical protein